MGIEDDPFYMQDDVTLWEYSDSLDRQGLIRVSSPTDMKSRWTETDKDVVAPNGEKVNASVSLVVPQDVPLLSIIRQGLVEDLPDTVDSGLYQVVWKKTTQDGMRRATRRRLLLTKFRGRLPEVV